MTLNTSLRPGPKGQAIIARDDQLMSGSMIPRYPFVIDRGLGAKVWDVDGNEYIDFAAGIAVNSTGHCHPEVVKAITEQAQKFIHIAGTDYYYEVQVKLAEKLSEIAPFKEDARVFLANSGAETIEAAVKLARWYTERPHIIAFFGAFHGRTMGALSLTASKVVQRDGFFPLIPGVYHVPYNNPYRCLHGREESACRAHCTCVNYVEDVVFKRIFPGDSVAAIVMEPIQGEGGYVVPDSRFVQEIRALCDKYEILMIMDEVQTGMGRTGRWWGVEHHNVEPDIVCSAKGIASGMPLGAIIAKEHVMSWPPGAHGTTFGGNPISCAAALVTIDLLEKGYMANAADQGAYIMDALEELRPLHPTMQHARIDGKGLMIGVELVMDATRKPAKDVRNQVERHAIDNGLLLLGAGESTLRFIPPLMIERDLVDEGLKRFDQSLTQAEQDAELI
ncbi:MAG: acetyl ornithine aminotransferase family protein [Anaerolineae bacterium]|nr:acetyl ornithine aminotransferase family protein [Anaerolineae bacterium]